MWHTDVLVSGQLLNLLSSILTILLTCPSRDTLFCYSGVSIVSKHTHYKSPRSYHSNLLRLYIQTHTSRLQWRIFHHSHSLNISRLYRKYIIKTAWVVTH